MSLYINYIYNLLINFVLVKNFMIFVTFILSPNNCLKSLLHRMSRLWFAVALQSVNMCLTVSGTVQTSHIGRSPCGLLMRNSWVSLQCPIRSLQILTSILLSSFTEDVHCVVVSFISLSLLFVVLVHQR